MYRFLLLLTLAVMPSLSHAVEEPDYEIVRKLGNVELLETELANTNRALKQTGINPLEKAILKLLGKLITRPTGEWRIYQKRFGEELVAIAKTGAVVFGLQEMQIWVGSRLADRTIAAQLRQLPSG